MKKVLVAEDSVVDRELIRELLEIRDYEVFEAGDGQQALEKTNEARPEILLLDLGMPVLDGFRTIARIREILSCGHCRSRRLPPTPCTATGRKSWRLDLTIRFETHQFENSFRRA
jgi:CheY-like chemotaxis protein